MADSLFITPEACTEALSVGLHRRAFAIYAPGTTREEMSAGRAKAWADISQWRTTPCHPWDEFKAWIDSNRLNLAQVKQFAAGMEKLRAVLAKWEAGSPEWDISEKFRLLEVGESLQVGDFVQEGAMSHFLCIDRTTPARAYCNAKAWPITITANKWRALGSSKSWGTDFAMRPIKPETPATPAP